NAAHMAIKAGPFGLAHQQEDKLSFELYANGELFLIDPGYYIYNSNSNWRKYFRSSLAHNTIIPDGLSQFRSAQRGLWENKKPNDAVWESTDDYDFFSGSYQHGYGRYEEL